MDRTGSSCRTGLSIALGVRDDALLGAQFDACVPARLQEQRVAGPLVSALVIAQHVYEHNASAVIVPGFEHADSVRHVITDLAALITPMCVYPRGYRWPLNDFGSLR
ncbi:hypothetical protein [Nocardia sp. NPDC002869]|uniref:hypothetical protein n=1 Tax=Nocardia sp. NPDC002869 TaxID=3161032 RepID=UPI00398D26B4